MRPVDRTKAAVAPELWVDLSTPALRIVPVRLAEPFDAEPFAIIDRIRRDRFAS